MSLETEAARRCEHPTEPQSEGVSKARRKRSKSARPVHEIATRLLRDDVTDAMALDGGVLTQDGVARVFARKHADRLAYDHHVGGWFKWIGSHWQRDETELAFQYCREIARDLTDNRDTAAAKAIRKVAFAAGVERFARGDPVLAVTSRDWDANAHLLGTPGGTIDLRTGELREAAPDDRITRIAAITPAPAAHCPRWSTFLEESTGGDADLCRFLRQWAGLNLTGDVSEHTLVFLHGGGGNGKSVFVNTLAGILGAYATTASMDTFVAQRNEHPTSIAMLRGARMVTAVETEEGHAWAEARIKALTGGDKIAARFMRQNYFEFRPQFKLTIVGNHRPVLRNVDDAMRRRLCLVPFTRKPLQPDTQLEEKLRIEWPGILRWMIEGCLDWQRNGLVRPAVVRAATDEYFDTQDVFGQWLGDECEARPGDEYMRGSSALLFESWSRHARQAGEPAGTRKSFAELMQRRGFVAHKGTGGIRQFLGIRLKPSGQ